MDGWKVYRSDGQDHSDSDSLSLWGGKKQTCNHIKHKNIPTKFQEFTIDFLKACGFQIAPTIIFILNWYTDISALQWERFK